MSTRYFPGGSILVGEAYKPGDQAPSGYLDWHDWAEVQHKAGLRQVKCGRCGKWKFPQELSATIDRYTARTSRGTPVKKATAVCLKCEPGSKEPHATQAESRSDGQDQYLPGSLPLAEAARPDEPPMKGDKK